MRNYAIRGFRGTDEFFAMTFRGTPHELRGIIKLRKQYGWRVEWKRIVYRLGDVKLINIDRVHYLRGAVRKAA